MWRSIFRLKAASKRTGALNSETCDFGCLGLRVAQHSSRGPGCVSHAKHSHGAKSKVILAFATRTVRKGELPYDTQALKLAASLLIRAARCRDSIRQNECSGQFELHGKHAKSE